MTTPSLSLCRHIKTNGYRCLSPALTGETFCYFHARLHSDHPAPITAQKIVDSWDEGMVEAMISIGDDPMQIARAYPRQNEFNFPPLEDAESIQFAASLLFHAIAQGQVHLGRARILLSILRIANSSQRRAAISPPENAGPVHSIDHTPDGVPLAPAEPAATEIAPACAVSNDPSAPALAPQVSPLCSGE